MISVGNKWINEWNERIVHAGQRRLFTRLFIYFVHCFCSENFSCDSYTEWFCLVIVLNCDCVELRSHINIEASSFLTEFLSLTILQFFVDYRLIAVLGEQDEPKRKKHTHTTLQSKRGDTYWIWSFSPATSHLAILMIVDIFWQIGLHSISILAETVHFTIDIYRLHALQIPQSIETIHNFWSEEKKNKKERNGDLQKNFDCHQLSLNAGIRVYKLNNIDISIYIYISVWVFRCNRLECTHAHTQLMLHWQQLRHNQCNCRCHRHRQSNCTWNSSQNISKINIRVQV